MNRLPLLLAMIWFTLGAAPAVSHPMPTRGPLIAALGGPFRLIDENSQPFSERNLTGRPSAIFFGFTYCPEVCPTTLTRLSHWLKLLGPDAGRLNVVFVTVDPERDTPKQLKDYLSGFDPRIHGLTGSPREIARMAAEYKVFYRRVPLPGGTYTMEHSAAIYLMDASGRFVEPIVYYEPDAVALSSLRRLVGH